VNTCLLAYYYSFCTMFPIRVSLRNAVSSICTYTFVCLLFSPTVVLLGLEFICAYVQLSSPKPVRNAIRYSALAELVVTYLSYISHRVYLCGCVCVDDCVFAGASSSNSSVKKPKSSHSRTLPNGPFRTLDAPDMVSGMCGNALD
jgi:hypothetical protein